MTQPAAISNLAASEETTTGQKSKITFASLPLAFDSVGGSMQLYCCSIDLILFDWFIRVGC